MEQAKRAWLYCRIDAPEDTRGTLKGQKKELMDYAEQMDFEVVGESEDLGIGLDLDRAGLQEVMKAAGEGKMDVLLVKKLDRLGPNVTKALHVIQDIQQLGIQIFSPLEGNIRFANLNANTTKFL
jgi:DNA invertase Pin-like site-specific DNA recombinase